jgi:hypothetical protein
MKAWIHIVTSLLLGLALFPFIGWNSLIVLFSGVAIDIDHILWYYVLFGKINPKKCRDYCYDLSAQRNTVAVRKFLVVLHTVEFAALMAVLAFFYRWALFAFIGVATHQLMDIYDKFKYFGEYEPYSVIVFFKKYYRT